MLSQLNLEGNLSTFAELICDLSEYDAEILYPHLDLCVKIFLKHCEQPTDFTLALVARLIINLGEMVDPYLSSLVMSSLSLESGYTGQFI